MGLKQRNVSKQVDRLEQSLGRAHSSEELLVREEDPTRAHSSSTVGSSSKCPSLLNLGSPTLQAALGAATIGGLCYANSIFGEFVFDDLRAVVENEDLRPTTPWSALLQHDWWGKPLANAASHKSFRPLAVASFRLDYSLFQLHPLGYHLVNVLLHMAVCAQVVIAASRVFKGAREGSTPLTSAAITGALFAAHPVHTEAVASVVGRAELLSAVLFLLSFEAYCRSVDFHTHAIATQAAGPHAAARASGWLWHGFSLLLASLAMLAKETGITVIGVCVAYEVCAADARRRSLAGHLSDPAAGTAGPAAAGAAHHATCHPGPEQSTGWAHLDYLRSPSLHFRVLVSLAWASVSVCGRIWWSSGSPTWTRHENPIIFAPTAAAAALSQLYVVARSMWLTVVPIPLCCDWGMQSIPLIHTPSEPRNLVTLAILLPAAALLLHSLSHLVARPPLSHTPHQLSSDSPPPHATCTDTTPTVPELSSRQWRFARHHIHLLGLSFLVIPYLPATNVVVPVGFVIAERVLYLPSLGTCLLGGHLLGGSLHASMASPGVGLRGAGGAGRAAAPREPLASPQVLLVAALLCGAARTVVRNADWADAERVFASGVRTNPRNEKLHAMLGDAHMKAGRLLQAEGCFRAALALEPGDFKMHYSLGKVLAEAGRSQEAEAAYRGALRTGADFSETINGVVFRSHLHNKIGDLQFRRADIAAAWESFSAAAETPEGGHADRGEMFLAHKNLATLYIRMSEGGEGEEAAGQLLRAAESYRDAVQFAPSSGQAAQCLYDAGVLHLKLSKPDLAVDDLSSALQHSPDLRNGRLYLGIALQQQMRPKDALPLVQLAVQEDPSNAHARYVQGVIHLNLGEREEGAELLKQALRLDPNHAEAARHLKGSGL